MQTFELRFHSLALLGAFATLVACADPARAPSSSAPTSEAASTSGSRANAALEARYTLALSLFDHGAYEDAAELFAQVLLQVPREPGGDHLRHLLIQHIGWSLLGDYDTGAEAEVLDRGEAMLERYLDKHEALRPMADGEREDIYELLGEYTLRRAGETPQSANARLRELTIATQRHVAYHEVEQRAATRDAMVRNIEVDTRFAEPDDPAVQRYFRDPRYGGPSLFERAPEPFHPTRVLVRGWVTQAPGDARHGSRVAYATLAGARPALERCYERALIRGADVVERVSLDLSWAEGALDEAQISSEHRFDEDSARCVLTALRRVEPKREPTDPREARLHLTFFVQSARYPQQSDVDQGYGASSAPFSRGPISGGPIVQGAAIEDVSRPRPAPRTRLQP